MRSPAVRHGLAFGTMFAAIAIGFVLASTLTDMGRPLWLGLNQMKGVVCFALCGLAGLLVMRRTESMRAAMVAGALAGAIGGAVTCTALYVVPYAFLDHVHQYPFEHMSYLNSGAANIRDYLLSERGRATVTSTSLGLIPIVTPIAAILGTGVAALAGFIGKRRWLKKAIVAGPLMLAAIVLLRAWLDASGVVAPLPSTIATPSAPATTRRSSRPLGSVRTDRGPDVAITESESEALVVKLPGTEISTELG